MGPLKILHTGPSKTVGWCLPAIGWLKGFLQSPTCCHAMPFLKPFVQLVVCAHKNPFPVVFFSFFVVILDSVFFLFLQFLPSTLPVISAQGRVYNGCSAIVSAVSPHVWLCSSSSSRATLRMCAHVRGTVLTAGWWRWWWQGGAGGGGRGGGCLSVAAVSSVECLVVSHVAVNARNKRLFFWKSKRWNGALIHITCTGKCVYSLCIYEEAAHAGGLIWLAAGFFQRKHDLRFNSGFGSFFFFFSPPLLFGEVKTSIFFRTAV